MIDSSGERIEVEASVWVRTGSGWRRAFAHFPATPEGPAVWEVEVTRDTDGQVKLAELLDEEVGAVIVTDPAWKPTRRDQCEAIQAQATADLDRMRARLHARAPGGWTSRSP